MKILALTLVSLTACAPRDARTAQATPEQAAPAASSPAPLEPIDTTSETAFTESVLDVFRKLDGKSTWSASEALVLTNDKQWVVNLHRPWQSCQDRDQDCSGIVAHYAAEVLKLAQREATAPADRSQLMAVVRTAGYLGALPEEVRKNTISEPFAADLIVVYVVDEGGTVRGAKVEDLKTNGISREALPALSQSNLARALPPLSKCDRDSVVVLAAQNYYESSRLLLRGQWSDLAVKAGGSIVVAAPGNDVLVIACNPSPSALGKISAVAVKLWQSADRPLSPALLEWSDNGWRVLNPEKP